MKHTLYLLLCLLLFCTVSAVAETGDPMLSTEDLSSIQDSYEAFLCELEDLIVEKGLLADADRESWRMYQLGDFIQNGGYGMIAAMYTPDLLQYAREEDTLLRLSVTKGDYTLSVDTMRRYTPLDSALPGLVLESTLTDGAGLPVTATIRYTASEGGFNAWDALLMIYSDVGTTITNDGRAIYWSDQPLTDDTYAPEILLHIEVMAQDGATLLMQADLTLKPSGTGWVLENDALR